MKLNDFNKGLREEFNYYDDIKQKASIKPTRSFRTIFVAASFACLAIVFALGLKTYRTRSNKYFDIFNDYKNNYYMELQHADKKMLEEREDYNEYNSSLGWSYIMGDGVNTGIKVSQKTSQDGFGYTSSDTNYKTNNQEFDVDEADIAKFDENYVYYINYNYLYIYDLNGNLIIKEELYEKYHRDFYYRIDKVDDVTFDNFSFYYNDYKMLTYKNLIVVFSSYNLVIYKFDNNKLEEVYKCTDRIRDIRLYNNQLYYVYSKNNLSINNIDFDNTYYDGISYFYSMVSISKINLDTMEENSVNVLTNYASVIYMNNTHIVISNDTFFCDDYETDYTTNSVFTLDLEAVGTFIVKGEVKDKYYIDVYDNYLRVVSSRSWLTADTVNNSLTIFNLNDKSLVSTLDKGIGLDNEEVKSVTFEDDKCFIVTYEITDPLYEIDLSDQKNPKIVDTLHVPGYSSYLKTFVINDNKYVFGMGVIDGYNKYSIYKVNEDSNNELLKDLIFNVRLSESNNPLSLFWYERVYDNCLYVGKSITSTSYRIYKIDVESEEIITLYKEVETEDITRMFLYNGYMYLPQSDELIIEEF